MDLLADSRPSRRHFSKVLAELRLLAATKARLDRNLGPDTKHLLIAIKLHLVVNVEQRPIDSIDDFPLHVLLAAVPDNESLLPAPFRAMLAAALGNSEESPSPAHLDRLWQCVERRCRRATVSEVRMTDIFERTCLNAACVRMAPAFIVRAILSACANEDKAEMDGSGGSGMRPTMMQDASGTTPLAYAVKDLIHTEACLETFSLLLVADPIAASIPDMIGRLPLHYACLWRGPHEYSNLVRDLCNAYPRAVAHEDDKGMTPLHCAVQRGAPEQTVRDLLDVCPSATSLDACGYTPLLGAVMCQTTTPSIIQALVDTDPLTVEIAASTTEDSVEHSAVSGLLPIHCAIYRQHSAEVVTILAKASPAALLRTHSNKEYTPLHIALFYYYQQPFTTENEKVIQVLLQYAPNACNSKDHRGFTPLDSVYAIAAEQIQEKTEVQLTWNIMCMVLRTTITVTVEADASVSKNFTLLHSMVYTSAPPEVVRAAIERDPKQAMEFDDDGRLPLMCALLPSPFEKDGTDRIADVLLNACPDAAKVTDKDGRSVLALAAEYGVLPDAVLERLISAWPHALSKSDPKHGQGMYPFLVAALPKQWERKGGMFSPHQQKDRKYRTTSPFTIQLR